MKRFLTIGIVIGLLVACTPAQPTPWVPPQGVIQATSPQITPASTATSTNADGLQNDPPQTPITISGAAQTSTPPATRTPGSDASPTALLLAHRTSLGPNDWKTLPIIPSISQTVLEIYLNGLALGNNPQAFSKIGDCGSTPAWFLGDFDRGPEFYNLGNYSGLQNVINEFQGSFDRTSLAARSGFNASSLFVPLWADRTYCQTNEAPLACEYRVHRPILAFIMLGTNDVWRPDDFEPQMRQIIEFTIAQGIIPVLSTKADNIEGDGRINAVMAQLALEYDIPLWNYWLAVQSLPNQGLQEDQAHLTWGRNFFNSPEALSKAWPVRNLNALQILNAVWQKVKNSAQ
jgi:hypothetical protein